MSRALRILYAPLQDGYTRNQESTLELLAERGHHVHIAQPRTSGAGSGISEALSRRNPRITVGPAPRRERSTPWGHMAWMFRMLADFARFLHPRYADAPLLRARVAQKIEKRLHSRSGVRAAVAQRLFEWMSRVKSARLSNLLVRFFVRLEQAVPRSASFDDFIREQAPDVLLVTPLVNVGSEQVDWIRGARALGVPSALCVASWDNLTNKGLMRVLPDRVYVWNDIQKREAAELHGMKPDRVRAVGAQRFDDWFGREPSRPAEKLCKKAGLDPGKPYLLYLCSSPFVAPDEVDFVNRWIEALRHSDDPTLREIGVLVRPHPQNVVQWFGVDLSRHGNATLWPQAGADVIDEESRNDFYDSLAHSLAVVGMNTTALIEAAVAGKSVFTVLAPEFRDTQEGTLHFHYLRHENGGILHEAGSLEEHLAQLERQLSEPEEGERERLRAFTESFVRPAGLDVPATPLLADEIEDLGRGPRPRRKRTPLWAWPLRLAIGLLVGAIRVPGPRRIAGRLLRRRREAWLDEELEAILSADGYAPSISLKRLLRRFQETRGPRTIGPWTGSLEDEVLCWIPFLRGLDEDGSLDPTRDVVRARADRLPLYASFEAKVEPFDGPDGDASLPARIAEAWFAPFLAGHGELKPIVKHLVYERLSVPPGAERRIAVAAHASAAFTEEQAARELAEKITAAVEPRASAVTVDGDLAAASAAIAGAEGFIGTWGDEAVLAVLLGIPTLVVAPTNPAWATRLSLAIRMARATGAPLTIVDRKALPLVAAVSARVSASARA